MIIHRLRLINFRCFDDAEFEFINGLNLIVGVNGAGKSTLLESIGIVLFNSPKTSLKDAIAKGKDYGSIYLEFDDCKIRRSFGSIIEYILETPEGKWEGKDTVISKLSQMLGIPNLESFWYDVLTIKQFAKLRPFDGTPNERLLLFGRILGIERYEQEFVFLKDVLAYGKKLIDELEQEIELTRNLNQQALETNELVDKERGQLSNLYASLEAARESLRQAEIASHKMRHLIEAQAAREHLSNYLSQLELKAKVPAGNRIKYEKEVEQYEHAKNEYLKSEASWQVNLDALSARLNTLKEINSVCPVCGTVLSEKHRNMMVAEVTDRIEELKQHKPRFEAGVPIKPQRFDDDGISEEIARVKQELTKSVFIPELPRPEALTQLAKRVATLEQRVNEVLSLEKTEVVDLHEKALTLQLYRDAYDQIELYRKGIKNKISTIPVEAREAISKKANTLYQSFMEGHHSVGLTLDSSYGIVASIRGQEVPFGSLGGAESVTAALAVRLAISHYLAREVDLLFLDEATDALDKTAQEQMVRIVEELQGQVFVITHENVFTKGNVIEI